jgi:predicted transcriptional regulator
MEKEKLEVLIKRGLTISEIKDELGCGRSTVAYYLNKYKLATLNKQQRREKEPCCIKCGETDCTKFYGNDKIICRECHKKRVNNKGRENREYAVNKLGGKCANCGYNRYIGSLDIHHLDPSIKDENFKSMRGWSIIRIDREIENCVLLCRNCHSELHGGYITLGD